ncbi:pentatricopeptide repeat-containing protein [Cocos nucifera]|uniref:Pentatricopeptide repeat-containing protein n=1 Tax=Cocos nucifera TaxID=13894 RepID=A0A8K0IHK4_COCNU|nr:pentatricopeptide repeat-containing protein [Cocos nucifera]
MRERAASSPTLATALERLIRRCQSLRELRQIHAHITASPHLDPRTTASLLSRLLFFCATSPAGSLPYASALFRRLPSPTLSAYNAMIQAHAMLSSPLSALSLYVQMLAAGVRPDHLTFPFLFKHCSLRVDSAAGRSLHAHVSKLGLHLDIFVQNAMIYMYSTCGLVDSARRMFDEMPHRDVVSWNSILIGYLRCGKLDLALRLFLDMKERNTRTWNSIITGFAQGGRSREALALFHEMQLSGNESAKPDKVTVASVVSACASLGALDQGKWVHGYLKRHGLEFDVVIGTALIDMYGKCGCVERAMEVFQEIPNKDVLAWTAMISAFAIHGLGEEAFGLLEEMEWHGTKPNYVTFGALLSACAHAGLVEKGRWCFNVMKRIYLIEPQLQHYACMVDLLGRAGLFEEAERLIRSMPMEPDLYVWGALLGACRMHGNVEVGERVAGYLIGLDPLNHAFYIILSDIYAKANRFENVKKVRSVMKECWIKKTAPGCSMIEVDGQVLELSAKGAPENLMMEIEWVLNGINGELKSTGYLPVNDEELLESPWTC